METKTILAAITALNKASDALNSGKLDIPGQIALATECFQAAWYLRHQLEQAIPQVALAA